MDDKKGFADSKRVNSNTMDSESPCKIQKLDDRNVQTPDAQQVQNSNQSFSFVNLSQSIDSKMSNIAKLRQQFVEEVKSIESSQKESIKNLKQKILEINQKIAIFTAKLKEANEFLFIQSEVIYKKEEENKVLRDKVAELFGYQKILYENMEAISNTLSSHENLSNHLINEFDHVMLTQDNDITTLEERLRKLTPNDELLTELDELNLKLNEQGREIIEYESKNSQLELELKEIRNEKENEKKQLVELDKKIAELEANNNSIKENASLEKSKLFNEIQQLDQEINDQVLKKKELEAQTSQLEQKLKIKKGKEYEENQKQITEANIQLHKLSVESGNLDSTKSKNEQEIKAKVDKIKEEIKAKKAEQEAFKEKKQQATTILGNKISELEKKIKCYDGVEIKLQKIETDLAKENELCLNSIRNCDEKKKELTDKIKTITEKINDNKSKLTKIERDISEAEGKIRLLEKEIREVNEKYENKLKASEESTEKIPSTQTFKPYELPNIFMSEGSDKVEKEKNRKKIFTPTSAENELDIDSLTLEEQVTHLTQVSTSSPEKARKFFKHTALSQPKAKKDNTPKGRGRGKK